MFLEKPIQTYIEYLKEEGLLRERQLNTHADSSLIHFDSNDYLALTQNEKVALAYQKGYSLYPSGSGGSMLLSGYHAIHQEVEQAFAHFLEVDECILLPSGYAANLAVAAFLGQLNAHCFIDKGVHASIYDGLALAKVSYTRYVHNDLNDLARRFFTLSTPGSLITEGIFSMSGQISPLDALSQFSRHHEMDLLVDEAHSFGVLGAQGQGAVHAQGLSQVEVPLRIIPLGKAFAAQGAIIAGQSIWIQGLLQAARALIYSTAVSPALGHGLLKTLDVVAQADEKRQHLNQLIRLFRELIKGSPLHWTDSFSAIQQLQLGCPRKALFYSRELKKMGIVCSSIRKPTVSQKATGLRIILNSAHQAEHLQQLFKALDIIYESQD